MSAAVLVLPSPAVTTPEPVSGSDVLTSGRGGQHDHWRPVMDVRCCQFCTHRAVIGDDRCRAHGGIFAGLAIQAAWFAQPCT